MGSRVIGRGRRCLNRFIKIIGHTIITENNKILISVFEGEYIEGCPLVRLRKRKCDSVGTVSEIAA